MFCFKFSFTVFLLMFFPLFSNVFFNIFKIDKLPKRYNKILKKLFTIIIYRVNSMSRSKVGYSFKNVVPKKSFFFVASMLSLFSTINLAYALEINIFRRDRIIQIWIISSKDINIQYLCKIYCRELGQYLMQFDALEKKCNETTNYSI